MSKSSCNTAEEHNVGDQSESFSLQCGISRLTYQFVKDLNDSGYRYSPEACLRIIVDAPSGFAFTQIDQSQSVVSLETCILVTWSQCPEYWEDLWDYQPLGLIVAEYGVLSTYLKKAIHGQRFRIPKHPTTVLTSTERHMFRLLSHGYTNVQIATMLNMQYQTIKNTLTIIYRKLNLTDRSDALLYYWSVGPYQQFGEVQHVANVCNKIAVP